MYAPPKKTRATVLIIEEINPTKARELFKAELTQQVANGWHIEIQIEFDAVLSKKTNFNWILLPFALIRLGSDWTCSLLVRGLKCLVFFAQARESIYIV